ncbi:hypothetical protein TIFTF001_025424 [Ficus carica]|uniref:Uncharacterized protein n=1 Tax=Ficus carica TaxID=3494 RepID=A0AA88DE57_FICCA|nr:hypothetical protein TIFTF001_025424 [Ficus carica]
MEEADAQENVGEQSTHLGLLYNGSEAISSRTGMPKDFGSN